MGYCGHRNSVPSTENPELSTIVSFSPEVGQNIALPVSPASMISTFLLHSTLRVQFLFHVLSALDTVDIVSPVGL